MRVVIILLCLTFLVACAPVEPQPEQQEVVQNDTIQINETVSEPEPEPDLEPASIKKEIRMTTCTESDGGYKVFTKGYAMARGRKVYDVCLKDADPDNTAYASTTLIEYLCRGDRYMNQKFVCPHGCENGACIKSEDTIALYE